MQKKHYLCKRIIIKIYMKKISIFLLLLIAATMSVQGVPSSFPRTFLLEHFTSENCNNCPMGMKYIVEYLNHQTTPYIWVSHHAIYGTDEYTLDESNALAMDFMGIYNVPSVVFNRTEQGGRLEVGATTDLVTWVEEGRVAEGDTVAEASVEIAHTYDPKSRQLAITVSGQVANVDRTAYLLTILIKENRLVGKQADQITSWKKVNWLEYMHPRVVRSFVNGTFGDTVKVENQAYSYSTTYTMDKDWVAENCCVVAYLTPLEKQPIINAEQVAVVAGTEGGEQYGPYGITEAKGPSTSISFDSVHVTKIANNVLEVRMVSNKTMSSYAGICKQVGYVYVNTADSVLISGTYPIQEGNEDGTITAGYRVDEEETLGGSRLVYALSTDLKNGIVTPIHMWRMSKGEMVLDENGNVSLTFTTYNGTTVTATAVYDFSPAAAGVEDVGVLISPEGSNDYSQANLQGGRSSGVRKVLREGQLLIEKEGEWYSVLGSKVAQ